MKLTKIKLHGLLGESIGEDWNLAVKSVSDAMRAIETLSKRKFYKFLLENDKKGIRYKVLINGRDFLYEEEPTVEKPESVLKTELVINHKDLRTIDIIPVIEGAGGGTGMVILGALLIIVGIIFLATGFLSVLGVPLIIIGAGLLAGGIISLLTSPPKFDDYQNISNAGAGKSSYLFSGPQNTTREGGPVPVGYGRLFVGSQVISASYEITEHDALAGTPLTT